MPIGNNFRPARGSRAERKSFAIFGLLALSAAVVAGGAFYWASQSRSTDPITGCPRSGPPDGITLILVDVSDNLTLSQRLNLENRFGDLKASQVAGRTDDDMPPIRPMERVELYVASGEPLTERPKPLVAACNPGGEGDKSELTANLALVRQKWARAFAEPFTAAVSEAMNRPNSDHSYILSSVQIAVQLLRRPEFAAIPKRLILVSDLLENSDSFNFYKKLPSLDEMLEARSYLALRTDFSGIDIDIWYLRRPTENVDWASVLSLWRGLIHRQGGTAPIDVVQIDG